MAYFLGRVFQVLMLIAGVFLLVGGHAVDSDGTIVAGAILLSSVYIVFSINNPQSKDGPST